MEKNNIGVPGTTGKSAKNSANKIAIGKKSTGFTDEERAAMKERARELKAAELVNKNKADGEREVLDKIEGMQEPDRTIARRLHTLIQASAPDLSPGTWYGMPAYANKDDKIVCYFRDRRKFKERYSMFGFNDSANLDKGAMWPIAYALKELTTADEVSIGKLVKKAVK